LTGIPESGILVLMAAKKDEVTVKTSIEMPRELWRRVAIRAAEEETRRREILIRALEAYLATPARPSAKGGRRAR
jgi:ribonucleotide reductase alpha subunit